MAGVAPARLRPSLERTQNCHSLTRKICVLDSEPYVFISLILLLGEVKMKARPTLLWSALLSFFFSTFLLHSKFQTVHF
jgi:hypothetical protein